MSEKDQQGTEDEHEGHEQFTCAHIEGTVVMNQIVITTGIDGDGDEFAHLTMSADMTLRSVLMELEYAKVLAVDLFRGGSDDDEDDEG